MADIFVGQVGRREGVLCLFQPLNDHFRQNCGGQQLVGFSGDEQVNGTWTLRVVDLTTGQAGTLSDWHLTITSRWD